MSPLRPDEFGLLRYATAPGSSSFTEFLSAAAPDLLPRRTPDTATAPHGTTIVALVFADGVVMAGDRRATAGNLIAQRDIEKVFATDDHSMVGIAGAAGMAIEIVRLYQVELEHYEKIEGLTMSLDGKANRLAAMIRGNLGAALQGLAVVPLFAGFDLDAAAGTSPGRIFSYDVTGGNYEERGYASVGSGSLFAKNSLKKTWRPGLDSAACVRTLVEALYDAADDDSATGGPDLTRKIWPVVMSVTDEGLRRLSEDEVGAVVQSVVDERMTRPGG